MNAQTKYFHLKVIDTKNIVPHEDFDDACSSALIEKIKKTQTFLHPILVAHVEGETYMQIDGMNRYSSIKKLKIPSILCQIVDYNDQKAVEVSTWCHLSVLEKDEFIKLLQAIPNVSISEVGFRYLRRRYIKDKGPGFLCTVAFKDNTVYRCATSGDLSNKINKLKEIVALYRSGIARDILPDDANSVDVGQLFKKRPEKNSVVIFPTFTRHQIIDVAVRRHVLFPGGITRFIIQGRCMDVNYPLKYLQGNLSQKQRNEFLEKFLENKRHRLYEEPTIYFEP